MSDAPTESPTKPSVSSRDPYASPPAPTLVADDWSEMLGLGPCDLFECESPSRHFGAPADEELDVVGSLLADAMDEEPSRAAQDEEDVPAADAAVEEEATEPAAAPAVAAAVAPRHRPVPNSVTVGRAKRTSAGRAPKRLGDSDEWGVGPASSWSGKEEERAAKAQAAAAKGKAAGDEDGEDIEAVAPRRAGGADADGAARKRPKAKPLGPSDADVAMMHADHEADPTDTFHSDAFAFALGGSGEWGANAAFPPIPEPAEGEIAIPPPLVKPASRRRPSKPRADGSGGRKRAGSNQALHPLGMVKRGSSVSLAASDAASDATTAATTTGNGSRAIDLASRLYDALSGKPAAANENALGRTDSIRSSVATGSVAGSDVGGKSADELDSISATRPPSRNGSATNAAADAEGADGARVVGLAGLSASAAAGPLGVVAPGAPGGRGSKFERKDWTAEEDEIIRVSVQAYGMRWRKIAARLPGRSDDAVRNRWNRVNEEPTLLAGLRGGAMSLLEPSCFREDGTADAAAAPNGEARPAASRKRTRDGVRSAKAPRPPPPPGAIAAAAAATEADEAMGVPLSAAILVGPEDYGRYEPARAEGTASPTQTSASNDDALSSTTAAASEKLVLASASVAEVTAGGVSSASELGEIAGEIAAAFGAPPAKQAAKPRARPSGGAKRSGGSRRGGTEGAGNAPATRIVWSHQEDNIILKYVRAHGHDWKTLALELPARTPHAIRNRYHRLQTMAMDTVGLDEADGTSELLGASLLADPGLLQVAC